MQLKQSQKDQIRNIINSKLSHHKKGDDLKKEVEGSVFDLLDRSNFSSRDSLLDKLQAELRDHLKDNAHQISEQISKIVYSNDGNNNSTQKDEDQEQNLYKNKFYSDLQYENSQDTDHSDISDEDDDDDDDRRGKRKRNYKKRPSIHQSDLQSDNENKSLGSDSEARDNMRRPSRRDSYASNSGKRDQNNSNKDDKDSSYHNNRNQNNSNNGKYQSKYNNNNNNNSRFKNDKKNLNDRNNNNNGMNKRPISQNSAPLPSFMNNPSGMIPNLLGNNGMMNFPLPNLNNNMTNMNLMQPFPNLFTPRLGPPAPPTGKPTTSQAGTGAPSLTLNKTPKNIIYVFYIPPKLNNVAKLSYYFTNKFGAVSAYDKIDDTTASIKFEKEEFAKKAVESKEKPFKIEQIVVTFTKSPAPPKPAFVNRNNNNANTSNANGNKPFLHNKPNLDGSEPPKQKFVKPEFNNNGNNNFNNNNNNNAAKPKLQMNFEQKKKQKQFDEQKRLIQLKFADKLKVMIFIKQRETDPESLIRKEVQRCIDQIKQIKDTLSKSQSYEDLQQIEQNELIVNHYFEFQQKVHFAEGQEMSLTELRPKLLEYGKVETLKPHLIEKAVDVGFTDFQSAEKAYFGLQGQYDIKFVHEHILTFLKNPFQNVVEEQENEAVEEEVEQQQGDGEEYVQNYDQQDQGEQQYQQQDYENVEQQQQFAQDENNQEYYGEEQGQDQYQEQYQEDQQQQQQYNEEEQQLQYGEDQAQYGDDQQQQYYPEAEEQQILEEQQNNDDDL